VSPGENLILVSKRNNIGANLLSRVNTRLLWGQRDLNPHDLYSQRIFILLQLSLLPLASCFMVLRIGPSLHPRLDVRVAPVGPLHLPKIRLGLAQDCLVCNQI